jgi:hypothetical protein
MKKLFYFMVTLVIAFGLSSCKCTSNNQDTTEPVIEQEELVVENLISTDREEMYLNYGEDYR